jgi:hypothetical protein
MKICIYGMQSRPLYALLKNAEAENYAALAWSR